jgi:type IV pilus assembly protein PilW
MPRKPSISRTAAGFGLVDILVGMFVAMLATLVVAQVFAVSEGQKRTITGGSDAQTVGSVALYGLERDIRQSGYGANATGLIGCDLQLRAGVILPALAPVTINHASIPAGDANTDTLLVVYGNGNSPAEGDRITAQPLAAGSAASPDIYAVQTPASFAAGDRVVAAPRIRPSPCGLALAQVASVGTGSAANVVVASGTGVANLAGGVLYNLGPAPRVRAYAVRGGNLTVCDYLANDCGLAADTGNEAVWVPIAAGIVSLRAQYGRDSSVPMDAAVDVYDASTPPLNVPAPSNPALTAQCGWARIPVLRLALVARSAQMEKEVVTTTARNSPAPANAPAWAGEAGSPIVAAGAALGPDAAADEPWKHYRYKAFQTVVPVRNVAWLGVQAGC